MSPSNIISGRPAIAVAGIRGGSGKTIVSLGLIRAMMMRGMSVASFKKGPDYIDPAWLSLASGLTCYNLDSFLMDENTIVSSFSSGNAHTDCAVIEGNRGMFDGFDVEGTHSFAELVKTLRVPLILVVECTKSSRSIAAVVHGCNTFDDNLSLSGVILNHIAGDRHRDIIKNAIERYCRIPVLGVMPRIKSLSMRERHLGLVPAYEHENPGKLVELLGNVVTGNVDMDAVVSLADSRRTMPLKLETNQPYKIQRARGSGISVRTDDYRMQERTGVPAGEHDDIPVVGVVRDSAFNFYYPENIERITHCGAKVISVSALDGTVPSGIDALYIGGGFPETHAERLSGNAEFLSWIVRNVDAGMPVYAECGGLVYLSRSLKIGDVSFPMAGVFPLDFEMSKSPEGHGYTIFEVDGENPFYKAGTVVRGHEFRYSKIINTAETGKLESVFKMRRGRGLAQGRDGILFRNTLAAFSHTHASSANIQWIQSLVSMAKFRKCPNPAVQSVDDVSSEILNRR